MGKRFLAIIVIATICLCMFVACDEISDEKNVGKATTVSGAKTEKTTSTWPPSSLRYLHPKPKVSL